MSKFPIASVLRSFGLTLHLFLRFNFDIFPNFSLTLELVLRSPLLMLGKLTHSFRSLSYYGFIAHSKKRCPKILIQCFLFQLTACSLFLKVIQLRLKTFSSISLHFNPSFYLSFNNSFQKAVSTQDDQSI